MAAMWTSSGILQPRTADVGLCYEIDFSWEPPPFRELGQQRSAGGPDCRHDTMHRRLENASQRQGCGTQKAPFTAVMCYCEDGVTPGACLPNKTRQLLEGPAHAVRGRRWRRHRAKRLGGRRSRPEDPSTADHDVVPRSSKQRLPRSRAPAAAEGASGAQCGSGASQATSEHLGARIARLPLRCPLQHAHSWPTPSRRPSPCGARRPPAARPCRRACRRWSRPSRRCPTPWRCAPPLPPMPLPPMPPPSVAAASSRVPACARGPACTCSHKLQHSLTARLGHCCPCLPSPPRFPCAALQAAAVLCHQA